MAYQRGTTQVWINEVYLGTYKSTTTDGKGELFGFGDSSDSYAYGVDIDWLLWDLTGAYGPNESAALPAGLQTPTQLKENATSASLLIYPNPSNGSFVISGQKDKNLKVLSLDGSIVFQQTIMSNSEQVNVDVKSGIYIVRVGELINKIAIK